MFTQKRVQRIVIDTTDAYTELCNMGRLSSCDKSPYGDIDMKIHRHPYTGVYSMLFAAFKYKHIEFAEIGVAGGSSFVLWWNYFVNASFSLFDRDQQFLDNITNMEIPNRRPHLGLMDVSVDGSIKESLEKTGKEFDIIIDDSSHDYEHQIRIVKEAFPFVKSGGYLILEDVFRAESEKKYEDALSEIIDQCSLVYFLVCNHEERYSPGWNNDKLLVFIKK